ncbi:hypothetical protein GOBAR_AA33516 [Gossypium barbadense]|uniref:RRM domain-containing protein n=1 Tax=Gossypium barbadense TaxID=3634 RepID=A0A2P5W7U8_GOSBA|nr:hypothetical protein GOBAR_AA33516 [Gossypium barbadense]
MAFLSKIGGILKQTASMQLNARLSESRPGLFQVFRSMSSAPSSKLFVGGISFQTDDQSLKEAFSKYGEVVEARVIVDRETGRSRGFGFITYTSTEDASSALQALDGQILHGRQVRVDYANDRPRRQGSYDGDNYGTGSGVGYGSNFGQSTNYDNGSFEVAGGGSGNDGFAAGGENVGFGGGDQLGSAEDSYKEETAGFGLNDPPSDNFQDEEEDRNGDLSKRV